MMYEIPPPEKRTLEWLLNDSQLYSNLSSFISFCDREYLDYAKMHNLEKIINCFLHSNDYPPDIISCQAQILSNLLSGFMNEKIKTSDDKSYFYNSLSLWGEKVLPLYNHFGREALFNFTEHLSDLLLDGLPMASISYVDSIHRNIDFLEKIIKESSKEKMRINQQKDFTKFIIANPFFSKVIEKCGEKISVEIYDLINKYLSLDTLISYKLMQFLVATNLNETNYARWFRVFNKILQGTKIDYPSFRAYHFIDQSFIFIDNDEFSNFENFISLFDSAIYSLPKEILSPLMDYSFKKREFLIKKLPFEEFKCDKMLKKWSDYDDWLKHSLFFMERCHSKKGITKFYGYFCDVFEYKKDLREICSPRIDEIKALHEIALKKRKFDDSYILMKTSYLPKMPDKDLYQFEDFVELLTKIRDVQSWLKDSKLTKEDKKFKREKWIQTLSKQYPHIDDISGVVNFLISKDLSNITDLNFFKYSKKRMLEEFRTKQRNLVAHKYVATTLLTFLENEEKKEIHNPVYIPLKTFLARLIYQDDSLADATHFRIERNRYLINNFSNRIDECIFGPKGRWREASLMYHFDDAVEMVAVNAYEGKNIYKKNEEWRYLNTIGMAVLAEVNSLALGKKYLAIDTFGANIKNFWYKNLNNLFAGLYFKILEIAYKKGIKYLFVNTSHSGGMRVAEEFVAYLAKQRFGEDSENRFWCWNRERGRKKFKLVYGVKKRIEGHAELSDFEYTHYLEKPPIKLNKKLNLSSDTELYFDMWFPWNKYLRDNYSKLSENSQNRFPYAKRKYEKGFPEWNIGKGYVLGFEIEVNEALGRMASILNFRKENIIKGEENSLEKFEVL